MEAVSRGDEEDEMDVEMEDPQAFQPIDQDDLTTGIEEEEFQGLSGGDDDADEGSEYKESEELVSEDSGE